MSCRCSDCWNGPQVLTEPHVAHLANGAAPPLPSVLVETPPELEREYQAMLDRAAPQRRPRLMCRNRVAQVGRWFAQGVLVLGLYDIRERAHLLEKALTVLKGQGTWSRPVPDIDVLNRFARRQVLAHELGHELDRHDKRPSPYQHPESAADYWAGWLEAQNPGSDEEMGAVFFATIGCNVQGCSHPRSSVRAEAYRAGFATGRELVRKQAEHQQQATQATARAPSPSTSSGPSLGEVLLGFAAVAAVGYGTYKVVDELTKPAPRPRARTTPYVASSRPRSKRSR